MDDSYIRELPAFKKMMADRTRIIAEFESFEAKYQDFLNRDDTVLRVVLRSHLIVEHFIDEYLKAICPAVVDWDGSRLTFAQKLALIDNDKAAIHIALPAVRRLNRLRNQLAHNLGDAPSVEELKPITDFVNAWRAGGGKGPVSGLDSVSELALVASMFLNGATTSIRRYCPNGGLQGLIDWYSAP